jgi:hypothetical protein
MPLLKQVKFHDRDFLLIEDNLITTAHRYRNFLPSYAWIIDGRVIRWGKRIGYEDEIKAVLTHEGHPLHEYVEPTLEAVQAGLAMRKAGRGWTEDQDPGEEL